MSLLITLLIVALILALIIWVIDLVPVPAPFGMVAKAIVAIIVLIWLLSLLIGIGPTIR